MFFRKMRKSILTYFSGFARETRTCFSLALLCMTSRGRLILFLSVDIDDNVRSLFLKKDRFVTTVQSL